MSDTFAEYDPERDEYVPAYCRCDDLTHLVRHMPKTVHERSLDKAHLRESPELYDQAHENDPHFDRWEAEQDEWWRGGCR